MNEQPNNPDRPAPIDDRVDWAAYTPEQQTALAGMSGNFAVARRLMLALAVNGHHASDGEDRADLASLLAEIAAGDAIGVCLALAAEAVRANHAVFGEEHLLEALLLRSERQSDLAARNASEFGGRPGE